MRRRIGRRGSDDGRPQWVCGGRASDRRGGARAPASRCLVLHRLAGWWAMIGPYTALEAAGLGVIVLGEPEDVQELLDCGRDPGQSAALITEAVLVPGAGGL